MIQEIGPGFVPVPGTEKELDADTVCLAVGLTPSVELAKMAGVQLTHIPKLGGFVPLHGKDMRTTDENIYVAGDVSGIEEASTAMESGRLAGCSIAEAIGALNADAAEVRRKEINERINQLRSGIHGEARRDNKGIIVRRYEEWLAAK